MVTPSAISNFISTIDIEFGIKATDFEGCKTEQDVKDETENIMEVKYAIHTHRMEGIKPTLRSNEEASSFFKRTLVDFNNAKIAQCHWQNLLTHLILNNLPDTETFKKQRDYLSSYLSEIAINNGGTAKADLKNIEKCLIHIEDNLRSKGHTTSQVINSGKNRRTFQGNKNEDRCNICNRKGHTEKECKSPCWHCKKIGHRNRDCPNFKNERG